MTMNPAFMQLLLGFAQMGNARRAQVLDEKKFAESQQQFKTMVDQWNEVHHDEHVTRLLDRLGKTVPEARSAMLDLEDTGFLKPQEMAAFKAFASGQPLDAAVALGQQGVQQGQLPTALATGTAPPPGVMQALGGAGPQVPPQAQQAAQSAMAMMAQGPTGPQQMLPGGANQAWQGLVRDYASRQGMGMTPAQLELERFGAATGRQQVEVNMAEVQQRYDATAAELNLRAILGKHPGQLTPADAAQAMKGMGDLLVQMRDPKSSRTDNLAREQLYNSLNLLLQQGGYTGSQMFQNPGWPGVGGMSSPGDPRGALGRAYGTQFPGMPGALPPLSPFGQMIPQGPTRP